MSMLLTGIGNGRSPFRLPSNAPTPDLYTLGNQLVTVGATNQVSEWGDLSGNGNDATQGTAANQPYLSRGDNQENRALYSEQFDNAVWTKGSSTVTANTAVNPVNGATTADTLTDNTDLAQHRVRQSITVSAVPAIFSVYAKAGTRSRCALINASTTVEIDLTDGSTVSLAGAGTVQTEDVGDGWWRILLTQTLTAGAKNFDIAHSATNYNGTGETIFIFGAQVTQADSTYIPTTTFPQIASPGNGNKSPVFDGVNDSLGTSLAVNPAGGMWGWAVVRSNSLAASQFPLGNRLGGAGDRFSLAIGTNGSAQVFMFNGNTNFISRVSAASSVAVNQAYVLLFTYDGTTDATGIKIYNGLTQVDTTSGSGGAYSVGVAGNNLNIGQGNSGSFLNGYLPSVGFAQGSVISDGQREAITRWLGRIYDIAV